MHYAGASARVAHKAQELGRANWEWIIAVLDACMRGVFEDLNDNAARIDEYDKKELGNLHMFTMAGTIQASRRLVWADEPRWLKRCEKTPQLKFCALSKDTEQRDVAVKMVDHCGLRQLTNLVEERRMMDPGANDTSEYMPNATREKLEEMTRSQELACGLHAVLLQAFTGKNKVLTQTVTDVSQGLRTVRFRTAKKLRSALFWKANTQKKKKKEKKEEKEADKESKENGDAEKAEENGDKKTDKVNVNDKRSDAEIAADEKKAKEDAEKAEVEEEEDDDMDVPEGDFNVIEGSERDQHFYYDEADRAIYVGATNSNDDSFAAELVVALRRGLPLLWHVDSFLLEALFRCAMAEGATSIPSFLSKRDIEVDNNAPRHLGPGDKLPDDLEQRLIWAMDATYGEGECVAVLTEGIFVIAEIVKFDAVKCDSTTGLTRSYMLKLGHDKTEPRKHFEVYKIKTQSLAAEEKEEITELVMFEGKSDEDKAKDGDAKEKKDEDVDAPDTTIDDAKQIADLKIYLKEMGSMDPDDYKAVMRRLFKTWHPDKAGDTPLAKRIFHMLRAHEQWYKRRRNGEAVGDDDWMDDAEGKKSGDAADTEALAIEDGERPEGDDDGTGGQASWFEEFEKEMKKVNGAKEAGEEVTERTAMPLDGAAPDRQRDMEDFKKEQQEREEKSQSVRIVDKVLATRYMQEAKLELVAVRRLMQEIDGVRSMPSRAVWHAQQGVEMGLKSAMLRTCGVDEQEIVGGAAHDLIDFITRLKSAEANTEEQRRAQNVPLDSEDVEWLKRAYLAARYPKPGRYGVPTLLYSDSDAERALRLAEGFLQWSERVEDLPDPNKYRRRWASDTKAVDVNENPGDKKDDMPAPKGAPSASAPTGSLGQRGKASAPKPPEKRPSADEPSEPAGKTSKTEAPASGVKRSAEVVIEQAANEPPRRWSRKKAA